MSETRIALLSSVTCLALVVWLVVRSEAGGRGPAAPVVAAAPEIEQLEAGLRDVVARLEALQSQLTQPAGARVSAAPATSVTAAEEKLDRLGRELQDLRLAVQAAADAALANADGGVSHNVDELRRFHRATDWPACEALMQRAMSAPDGVGRSYLDSDKSEVLGALLMSRPVDVLNRFGAPTRTRIVDGRFVWLFEAPTAPGEAEPGRRLTFTFEKGYVWDVEFTVP